MIDEFFFAEEVAPHFGRGGTTIRCSPSGLTAVLLPEIRPTAIYTALPVRLLFGYRERVSMGPEIDRQSPPHQHNGQQWQRRRLGWRGGGPGTETNNSRIRADSSLV